MNRFLTVVAMLTVTLLVGTSSTEAHSSPKDPSAPADQDAPLRRRRGFHSGLEFGTLGVSAVAQRFSFANYDLAESESHADVLNAADLRLTGGGTGYGGTVRAGYESAQGFRFGVGIGGTRIEGLSVRHGDLPDGVTIRGAGVAAANFQIMFGKTFNAGFFYPYVDAKVSLNIVIAEIELFTETYGFMGASSHVVPTVSVAPRLGVVVPLDSAAFMDLSAEYGLFGAERFGGQLQFGVMLDLR